MTMTVIAPPKYCKFQYQLSCIKPKLGFFNDITLPLSNWILLSNEFANLVHLAIKRDEREISGFQRGPDRLSLRAFINYT